MRKGILILAFGISILAPADTLEFKNGALLRGGYQGGTAGTVRFNTDKGLQVFSTGDIVALTFETTGVAQPPAPGAPQAPGAPPAPASAAAPAGAGLVVPIGTKITVRTIDQVTSNDPAGKRFEVTVDSPVTVADKTVIPPGTKGFGSVASSQQAGHLAGSSEFKIALTQLVLNGKTVEIRTDPVGESGKNSAGKVVGSAALGTAVGAVTGNAGRGAVIGGVVGAARRGQVVGFPPKTLLDFTFSSPLVLQ